MRAFLWLASEGKPELLVPVGSGRNISLCSTPIQFEAPCGLSDVARVVDEDPVDEIDEEEPFELPADKQLSLSAYVAGDLDEALAGGVEV